MQKTLTLLFFFVFKQFAFATPPSQNPLAPHVVPIDTVYLTLPEAWEKAELHSKLIIIQRKNTAIALAEYKDAKIELFPEISVKGTAEKASNIPIYENGLFSKPTQHEVIHTLYHMGAEFYQVLYHGNKFRLKIKEDKTLHQLSMVQENKMISDIRYRTASLYLDLQRCLLFKDLIIQDIADQEKQLIEIKHFHENGTVLKSDVLRVELDLSKRRMTLITIENDILIATQKLNIIFGEPDDKVITPKPLDQKKGENTSYEQYLEQALKHSFSYHISEKQTELSAINLKQVKANVRPNIGIYGDFYYANPQIFLAPYNPDWYSLGVIGVKATFPISSIYHNIHKVKAAKLELEKEEEAHHNIGDIVRQNVKEAYLRYQEALKQIAVAEVDVLQAKENARIIKNTYFNQTSLITDLLDADIQLLQTHFELASARILAQDKYYLLQNIIGVL
ncbi:transporter [Sphingobacterium sp. ML3W]|uniref:TolC family protein n=1 Tax=Sphingobacterium sp. ML3W TaxID=1538644 RepID=UPI0004F6FFFD|nr:TolC family protein [Sphingobacterium sp. ML3W]AIM39065.1 transporter [Sphingobacterium sp. ML3W]